MRYLGSKAKIAKDIVPIIQSYIDNNGIEQYWEPFVGGANIIDKINCKVRVGTDIHPQLIALLQQAQLMFLYFLIQSAKKNIKKSRITKINTQIGMLVL